MFCDIKGSTALAEQLDPEALRALLSLYFDEMGAVVVARGGVVAKVIGDAIVAVFDASGDPAAAAEGAVRAVLDGREALAALNDRFARTWGVRIENRTGVASGSLAAGEIDEAGTDAEVLAGDVIGAAESLESAAPTGQALIDALTVELVGGAVEVEALAPVPRKGGAGTVGAWRLVDITVLDDPRARPVEATTVPCPGCGAANDPLDRRCSTCDLLLGSGGVGVGSRRTVTVLFADPVPVTAGGRPLEPDATRDVMSRYFEVMRPILERHGATVEKFIGDALMAVFGLPVRHEDDAARAVRAASEMQAALDGLNDEIGLSTGVRLTSPTGVNTGSVVAGDGSTRQRFVTGDAVNVAARLGQTAGPREVIVGELTRRLAGDAIEVEALEPLVLKGKAEPVPAFRLVRVVDPTAGRTAAGPHRELPLVGRDSELDVLRGVLGEAVDAARARRVTLIGDAGVGKSRLAETFLAEAGRRAHVLRGSCLAYGEGITFWPLVRIVQAAAGIEEGDDADVARSRLTDLLADEPDVLDRVASLAGLVDTPYAVPELVWALRRLLERLARSTPLVVGLDDVHWAEPTLLDVVDQLTASVRAPVLFLCTARPSVLERHAEVVEGAPVLSLEPLDDEQCERMLRQLLGGSPVDAAVVGRIVEVAAGNPLFIEQLLAMLVDDGRLRCEDDRWLLRGDLAALEVPASIEAVLTARLDLLAATGRDTIEPASVIGRHFPVEAVRHLVDPDLRPHVVGELREIADRGLILPVEDEDPGYRFQHQLIREATYNGLLKQRRAVLHEDFVDWAEASNAARGRTTEVDEILGYHLEQAHRCWRELGVLDDHAVALGVRGWRRLTEAGERALARGDMSAAANLLTRAAALLPDDHRGRHRALLLAGNALHETGSFDEAIAAYERSATAADAAGDAEAASAARIEGLRLQYLIGRVQEADLVAREVAAALDQVGPAGDPDASSRIWQLQLNLDIAGCRWEAAHRAADEVIDHARRAGNDLLAVRTMPLLAFLAQKGPMPVPDAVGACTAILDQVAHDRRSTSLTQLELALLSAMALDVERARHLCADTRDALGELGWEMQAALVSLSSGPIELLADDPVRAEAELRRDYEALQRMDERNFISLTGVLLAEAVYRQRRVDEAAELVELARALAAPDDLAVQILLRTVSGKVAARDGDADAGLAMVDEAVGLMATTDDPSGLGDALLDQAEVRLLAGDPTGAAAAAAAARTRYLDKGNLAGVGRAERCTARIAAGLDALPTPGAGS